MKLTQFLYLLALLPLSAWSHDLWVEHNPAAGFYSLAYGHQGSSHAGAKQLEYSPDSIKQALCFNATGQSQRAVQNQSYPITLKGDCAATWFLLSSGYWSKTPYGTKNLPKNQAGASLTSWLSIESVKRIDRWGMTLATPLTQNLELVPLENPLMLTKGDKIHLQAFINGTPAAGVTILYFGKPRGVTGPDGKLNIRLNRPGLQFIQAGLEEEIDDARADKIIHGSVLQFQIP